ncbi:hypothetical protein CANARDRAFT_27289 [[Candida] arabinofermentans NRRL YB-2248]|uniref:Vacuolar-sorting protein SNF8 n=1 Tax=[Candida] arabinofermentans NRRL YB-2248 TaxID=983967 RepID=A0A1E4T5C8_9ASCO|nr:hypothetical protein CANARDRAFT_27289 [[Candida] arabinofermentans NRRL YB-2248]
MSRKGLASFENHSSQQTKFQNLGQQLLRSQHEELETQFQVFQNALTAFKEQYSAEIMENPKFRTEFSEICISFGVDPLIVSTDKNKSNTTSETDDKYNHLAMRIFEICQLTKSLNGGIIPIADMTRMINNEAGVDPMMSSLHNSIKEVDVQKAISNLKNIGGEIQMIKIGSSNYIKSIPQELNSDQSIILATCESIGHVSVNLLRDNFGWRKIRCKSNLEELVSNGLVWVDEFGNEKLYWATSWINKEL